MIVVKKTPLRKFGGSIIGWVEEDKAGNQQLRAFGGKILGYWDKTSDTTREFGGKKLGSGNLLMTLVDMK